MNTSNITTDMQKLKDQGHHFVGSHSAVKTCLWLKRSIRNEGACYKNKFYGISSHRCIQMTPSIGCNHRCMHCWRPIDMDVQDHKDKKWDDPVSIVNGCIDTQMKLISGFKGAQTSDIKKFQEAKNPKQAAISLIGEPTLYPFLGDLISEFHKKEMTTFLVTNGTNPDALEALASALPTQLYVSLNAPDEETYLKICRPFHNYWIRINESLEILSTLNTRTVIRITLADGLNIKNPEKYAELIEMARPDFIEVKAYMHLGFSRKRLNREAMPEHDTVKDFAEKIASEVGYEVADEVEISRVVVLSKDGTIEKVSFD